MKIDRIEKSLNDCKSLPPEIKPEIKDLLTRAILISICIEFNEKIKLLTQDKLSIIQDHSIKTFTLSCIENEFSTRNPNYKTIKKLVERFGESCKEKFQKEIDKIHQKDLVITYYNNIFDNRNKAAHHQTIDATLEDVGKFYEKAHLVLDCFQKALEIYE